MNLWWRLPGPGRFLEEIEYDLRQGRNVLIVLPEHHPPGLRNALNQQLSQHEFWYWRSLLVDPKLPESEHPLEFLHDRFVYFSDPDSILSVQTLVDSNNFRNLLLWIEGCDASCWEPWKDFLEEYAYLCRSKRVEERSLFCIIVPASLSTLMPAPDVALAIHNWRGYVDQLDMSLYATYLLSDQPLSRTERKLRIAMITELAGTDPQLAELLVSKSLNELLQPASCLCEFANKIGWTTPHTAPDWTKGTLDEWDGETFVHSVFLYQAQNINEIYRRLWRAHVRTLFPMLEEERVRLLAELKSFLKVPFCTEYGITIDNLNALEIGHIRYQIRNNYNIDKHTKQLLDSLKEIRDEIAHIKPVTGDLLGRWLLNQQLVDQK